MNRKILLINPSYKMLSTSKAVLRHEPPVALINLASFLEAHGLACDIVNTAFQRIPWKKIKNGEYCLVGFTVFIGEFLKNARNLSKKIKKTNSGVSICFGGIMASLFFEPILREYPVDYVIRYEGEHTLLELVRSIINKSPVNVIKGLSYRENGVIVNNPPREPVKDLDEFPVPRWDLLGKAINQKQIPYYFRIMASKGCPFQCSFCYSHSADESIRGDVPRWRPRSARHVIQEMESIHRITGATVFTFGDDNFLLKKDRVLEILDYVRSRGFYIEQCIGHFNNITDEIIKAMSGIVQTVLYAIETASPRLSPLLNKHLDLNRVPVVNKKLYEHGITTCHNFIIGLPTEQDEDLRMNVEFMMRLKEINPYVRGLIYLYLPLPHTPLSRYIETDMNHPLPCRLKDYEEASFDSGNESGRKFRPWLARQRYDALDAYSRIFNDAFQINNTCLSEDSLRLLKSSSDLERLFAGIARARHPKHFYRPYVLDRVLRKESIDLFNDLRNSEAGLLSSPR